MTTDPRSRVEAQLVQLASLRVRHGFRAVSLIPDIAFVGLLDDLVDAAEAGLQLVRSEHPHRAYAMVRAAFEASQRILVLGTAIDFEALGTRAWLYYKAKEGAAGTLDVDDGKTESAQEQLIRLWEQRYADARAVVDRETDNLAARRRGQPDNFLAQDMAVAVTQAYHRIAADRGTTVPTNSTDVNRAVYRSLSRETHACVRLEPQSMRIDSDGFADIVPARRDKAIITDAVHLGLSAVLSEAIAAIQYRLHQRQLAQAARTASASAAHSSDIPTNFKMDFGRHMLAVGVGHTTIGFPSVPLRQIRSLLDGTLSTSLNMSIEDSEYCATFDFRGPARRALTEAVASRFPQLIPQHYSDGATLSVDLPEPIICAIQATLGQFQQNSDEGFVPFDVVDLKPEI
jgi:hypothetical protein